MDPRLRYLKALREAVPDMRHAAAPKPYWSHRNGRPEASSASLETIVRRVRRTVEWMRGEHWFAEHLGFDCVDGHGEAAMSLSDELDVRVGKGYLPSEDDERWTLDDLCDFVEVLHDLSSLPISGWTHSYSNCGFHPDAFSRSSGQALYRWKVNQILDTSPLGLRIADAGEDQGRVVQVLAAGLADLAAAKAADGEREVQHAVAQFRARGSSREDRRLAIVELARVLEDRRGLVKTHLLRKDEGALFRIANEFDLRHRHADQRADYGDDYLEWIFHWYLATIDLLDRVALAQAAT